MGIFLNDGAFDGHSEIGSPTASIPKADLISIQPNETLASMTQRAYGANTSELRAKILHANGSIDGANIGEIRAPR